MASRTFTATAVLPRFAGRAAIASGLIGILAVWLLIAFLVYPGQTLDTSFLLQTFHDVGVALQFLLMIPVALGLHKLHNNNLLA
jgi:hypothetical protein